VPLQHYGLDRQRRTDGHRESFVVRVPLSCLVGSFVEGGRNFGGRPSRRGQHTALKYGSCLYGKEIASKPTLYKR